MTWSTQRAGKPIAFIVALSLLSLWVIIGYEKGFTTEWILILNTVGTVNAALMVFLIQHTQNRESKAIQIKLDELIRSMKEARNELMSIEEMEEEELEQIRNQLLKSHKPPSVDQKS